MAMKLEFNSIKNQSIFQPEFQSFSVNGYNVIEFKKQPQAAGGIAVVYAPNGTGKSSLTAVLGNEKTREDLSFEAIYNGNQVIQPETKAFHTIGDQISRNVIEGETSDYLIGQDIKREYVLKKKIADGFETAFNELNSEYKNAYKTTKVSDYLLSVMHDRNPEAYTFVRDIVNKQSKGKNIDRSLFLTYVRDVQKQPRLVDINREKREFVINNVKIVECLLQIDLAQIVANADVQEIEQNDDAINILGKYKHLHSCIVCDNDHIDGDSLLQRKQERRKRIYDSLDVKTKALLKDVAMDSKLGVSDPFEIKNTVLAFISYGELEPITSLREAILSCVNEIVDEMIVALFNVFIPTSMYSWWDEYSTLLEAQPTLDSEELLYIQEIISENIGRNIRITRDDDSDHNFKLMLDDQALLGLDRSLYCPYLNTVLYLNHYKRKEVITMPRTKGSKNRPKTNITKDYASQIVEKQETIASLNTEIASITANIDTLKADLKEKKTALKKAEKEVASLEAKKAKADAKAAEEAKKAEAESVVRRLLASGMSADEILEKLK